MSQPPPLGASFHPEFSIVIGSTFSCDACFSALRFALSQECLSWPTGGGGSEVSGKGGASSSPLIAAPYGALEDWVRNIDSPWHAPSTLLRIALVRLEDLVFSHPEARLRGGRYGEGDREGDGGEEEEKEVKEDESAAAQLLLSPPADGVWAAGASKLLSLLRTPGGRENIPTLVVCCPSVPAAYEKGSASSSSSTSSLTPRRQAIALLHTSTDLSFRNVTFITDDALVSALGGSCSASYYIPEADVLSHTPFSSSFECLLAMLCARWAHGRVATPRKVIVLDCDNTLWGGVVGEVGPAGLDVSFPFQALQRFLLSLQQRGALLCLASKNEEADVTAAFHERKAYFPLNLEDHIVAVEASWGLKSESLRRLSTRLNLGLDSFIFVDDNPLECAEVAAACPEVVVVHLPPSPADFPAFLASHWAFDSVGVVGEASLLRDWERERDETATTSSSTIFTTPPSSSTTAEDVSRTRMYKESFARAAERVTHQGFSSFLSSLSVRTSIDLLPSTSSQGAITRAAQLTLRTNQLNAHKRPYTEGELAAIVSATNAPVAAGATAAPAASSASSSSSVWTVHVADRFGTYGVVGLMIARSNNEADASTSRPPSSSFLDVDTLLLSCRVLQRGVEHAMIRYLGQEAKARGCNDGIRIRWVPSERNEPMRAFLWSLPGARHVADEVRDVWEASEVAALVSSAEAWLQAFAKEKRAAGKEDFLAAMAPAPEYAYAEASKRNLCKLAHKCPKLGFDHRHMLHTSHPFVWEEKYGLSEAMKASGLMSEGDAGKVARVQIEKSKIGRAFLGPQSPEGAGSARTKPAAGWVVLTLEAALGARFEAEKVDSEAESEADAAREGSSVTSSEVAAPAEGTAVASAGGGKCVVMGGGTGGSRGLLRFSSNVYQQLAEHSFSSSDGIGSASSIIEVAERAFLPEASGLLHAEVEGGGEREGTGPLKEKDAAAGGRPFRDPRASFRGMMRAQAKATLASSPTNGKRGAGE